MITNRFHARRHFRRIGFSGAVVAGLLAAQALGVACARAAGTEQQAEPQAAAPESVQTLASALADARVPEGAAIALTVDAVRVKLPTTRADGSPADTTPVPASASVARVADRFDRLDRTVGAVLAIAPRTMVVINTKLDKPNIYLGMPPRDVLTLLLATLTKAQWAEVTGEQGLALSSLHTDDQVMLVKALLPKGALTVVPWYSSLEAFNYKPEDIRDMSGSLSEARLRLSQSYGVLYPAADNSGRKYSSSDIPPANDGTPHYRITDRMEYGGMQDTLFGVPIRATVPNVEKANQLPMSDERLSKGIVPTDCKTVGDLIGRIATATGVEIYADPRYAILPLTIVTHGAAPAAVTARDLLRAVALCATATYRRVGPATEAHPAYVLTDDLVGMGTRQSLWYEFEMTGDALRAGPVAQAAQTLYTRYGAGNLKPMGDDATLAPPPGEKSEPNNSLSNPGVPRSIYKPFSALTPAEQAAVQRVVEAHNKAYTTSPAVAEGNISFYPQVRGELLLSSLPAPIDMNMPIGYNLLFQEPAEVTARKKAEAAAAVQARRQKYLADHPEEATKQSQAASAPPTGPLLPHRAVILSPTSTAEIPSDIAAMQRLNLNELWIALPFRRQAAAGANSVDPAEALLNAAIRAAQPAGIRVYPLLSPFADLEASSGKIAGNAADREAVAAIQDRNILGETSKEAERYVQERSVLWPKIPNVMNARDEGVRPIPPVFDNPLAPGVLSADQAQLKRLNTLNPPVAGVVFRETAPPGYTAVRGGDDMSRRLLGYTDTMRLAFLRQHHADPVDLYTPNYYTGKADTTVPIQKEYEHANSSAYQAWLRFRYDQNAAFLHDLLPAAGILPVLIQERGEGPQITYSNGTETVRTRQMGAFVSLDDPTQPLPSVNGPEYSFNAGDPNRTPQPSSAPRPPKISLDVVPVSSYLFLRSRSFGQDGAAFLSGRSSRHNGEGANAPQSSGFVLDLTAPNRDFGVRDPKDQEPPPTTLPGLADYVGRHPVSP